MATDVIAASLGHTRLAGAASGVALSTAAAFTPLIKGTKHVTFIPRNFATAVVMRYITCPYLAVLKSDRAVTLDVPPRDYSEVAQDGAVVDPRVDLSSLAAGRYVYVGSPVPIRGVNNDVEATNSTPSTVLTVRYWNGSAWTDLSATDGTSGTVSLDQDGSVTWTVPAAGLWKLTTLANIAKVLAGVPTQETAYKWRDVPMYWTRWEWDQALDGTVTLNHMLGINESTAYDEVPVGVGLEQRVHHGFGQTGIGGFELLVNAGTGNVLVKCATLDGYFSRGVVS